MEYKPKHRMEDKINMRKENVFKVTMKVNNNGPKSVFSVHQESTAKQKSV